MTRKLQSLFDIYALLRFCKPLMKSRTHFRLLNAIFIYFIFLTKSFSQSTDTYFAQNISLNTFKGFIMPHNDGVSHLAYGRPTGFELYHNWATDGSKPWQNRYNQPDAGVSIGYYDTDMDPTGNLLVFMTYMDFQLARDRFTQLYFRIGTGFTYAPTRYEQESNNLNVMISSPISYNMQGRLNLRIPISDRYYLNPGITLTHASNGAITYPNSGINMVTANLGFGYHFNKKNIQLPEGTNDAPDRSLGYSLTVSGAMRDAIRGQDRKYAFFTIRPMVDKTLNHVNRLLCGFDFFFNRARIPLIQRDENVPNDTDYKRIALVGGHELIVSRVSLMVMAGYYIYQPYLQDGDPNWYQRYGLKVYATEYVFGTMMLKAHGGRADNFAIGIGYRL